MIYTMASGFQLRWMMVMAVFILLAFLVTAIVLPTNSVEGLPIKIPMTGILLFYILIRLPNTIDSINRLRAPMLALLTGSTFILCFMILAVARGIVPQEFVLTEGRALAVMLLVGIAMSVYGPFTGISARKIIGCFLAAVAIFGVIKLVIFLAIAVGIIPRTPFRIVMKTVFNYSLLTGQIYGPLLRMQFPSDMLAVLGLPFLIPGVPPRIRIWWPLRILLGLLFMTVAVIGWSRVLLACSLILPLGTILLFYPRRSLQILVAIAILIIPLLFVWGAASQNGILDVLSDRFSGHNTAHSDEARLAQIPALLDMFDSAPLLGTGLGGYAPSVIRDMEAPFGYETQVVALLMKVGLLGIAMLAAASVWLLRFFVKTVPGPGSLVLIAQFCLLILASVTNPYLENSMSGILIGCLVAIGISGQTDISPKTDVTESLALP